MSTFLPIFIVGSARSGTTLLASIVGSSEAVAEYRAETLLMHGCDRYYGSLSIPAAKERFLSDWLRSRQFKRAAISVDKARALVSETDSYAELVGSLMAEIAGGQSKTHWIDSTPSNVFELDAIARHFPNAKVINIVRDGRAVAASLRKLGWTSVRSHSAIGALQFSALKWESSVSAFSRDEHLLSNRALSVSYESLITDPEETLALVRDYTGLDDLVLGDTGLVKKARVASNSAFGQLGDGISAEPMNRWRKQLTAEEIGAIEAVVKQSLVNHGYPLVSHGTPPVIARCAAHSRKLLFSAKSVARRVLPFRFLYHSPLELGVD